MPEIPVRKFCRELVQVMDKGSPWNSITRGELWAAGTEEFGTMSEDEFAIYECVKLALLKVMSNA
jgi:hypothetical protein